MTKRNDIEKLFRTHYEQMYRQAVILLHDDDLARDIVHDVMMALLDGTPNILITAGYLIRAVKNRSLNHIRDCEIHRRVASRYFLDNEEYDTDDWPDEETISRIYSLIKSDISPQARRVMQLRFSKGMPFAEIAAAMGISGTAVYRHLKNALTIIRQKIRENG